MHGSRRSGSCSASQQLPPQWPTRNVPSADVFPLEIVVVREEGMNGLIYLIGLIVVIMFVLSLLGLR